jgi:hypothetical protein
MGEEEKGKERRNKYDMNKTKEERWDEGRMEGKGRMRRDGSGGV